jgi:hypothetical protein
MHDARTTEQQAHEVEGFAKNNGLSPALNAILDKLSAELKNSNLLAPIDWDAAFQGITISHPR